MAYISDDPLNIRERCPECGVESDGHDHEFDLDDSGLGRCNGCFAYSRAVAVAYEKFTALRNDPTMHYRNGREARNGDQIIQLSVEGGKVVSLGVLYGATPGNDYCNGQIAHINMPGACLCDCLHVEDLAALLVEKGLDKRPAGK